MKFSDAKECNGWRHLTVGCIRRHRHERNFSGAKSFNDDLSKWYVSSANDMMSTMFSGVKEFNDDISQWDVSGVIDMSAMFSHGACESVQRRPLQVVRIKRK